jgi:hypothetical protein
LRDEHRWIILGNMLLRRIFGLMRAEGIEDYRKLDVS